MFINHYFNFLFFTILHSRLKKIYSKNMANNFTALAHATGCTILAGRYLLNQNTYNYDTLTSYSSAYFVYDLLFLLRYWKAKPLNYAYVYHHFAALYLMHQNPVLYKGGHILFLGELSNIPSYFVYYYQKQPNNQSLVKKLKYLQFFLYAGIRVPLIGNLLKNVYYASVLTNNYIPLIVGSPVFFMGLFWSKKLFDKL